MQPGLEVGDRRVLALGYRGREICLWVLGPLLWGLPAGGQPPSHLVGAGILPGSRGQLRPVGNRWGANPNALPFSFAEPEPELA